MSRLDIKSDITQFRQKIHRGLIRDILKWSLIVLLPAVFIQFFRILDTGFQPIMVLIVFTAVSIILCIIYQNRLSTSFLASTYIYLFFVQGIISIFNYGLIGGATWWFVLSVSLATLLLPKKVYNLLLLIAGLTLLTAAIVFSNKILILPFDVNVYAHSPYSWYTSVIAVVFVLLAISKSIERVNNRLIQNHSELVIKNYSLTELNDQLTQEIAGRKQAEDSVIESDKVYRKLFESANAPILIIDTNFNFLDCNNMALKTLGREKHEIIGRTPADPGLTPEYQPNGELSTELGQKYFSSSMEGNDLRFEWIHLHKDGTEIPVEISLFGFMASNKKNFFATWRDLTEVKKKENALIESEKRYRSLFHLAGDAGFIIQEGQIIDCNEKALALLDIDKGTLIGTSPWELSPRYQPDGLESEHKAKLMIRGALKSSPKHFEWRHIMYNGKVIDAEISLSVIDPKKELLIAVWRDITEKKQLERHIYNARVEAEENERARYAKELHDGLGPILSSVKFNFEWLSETNDPQKKQHIIELGNKNMEEAIVTLKEISNNLNPHILSNFGLSEAIKSFTEKASQKSNVQFNLSCNSNDRLNTELEIALYRVVQELINNTLKYAQATLVTINLEMDTRAKLIRLTYADDGIGFNLEEVLQKKLGFGLFNIQNRITLLGGNIAIHSQKNKGMQVYARLDIPAYPEDEK